MNALSDSNIIGVFDYICYEKCKDKNCRDAYTTVRKKSVSDSIKYLRDYRTLLWANPEKFETTERLKALSGRDHRNLMLIDSLFQMRDRNTGEFKYTLGYDRVWKYMQ